MMSDSLARNRADRRRGRSKRDLKQSPTGSALATELRTLNPRVRTQIGISDSIITLLEVIVIMTRKIMDDSDARPWFERFADLEVQLPEFNEETFGRMITSMENIDEAEIQRWVKRGQSKTTRLVLRRLIGAAAYDRLASAFRSDGALLVIALRRGIRLLLPTAVALDDCVSSLKKEQISEIMQVTLLQHAMLNIVMQLDNVFDQLLDLDLPLEDVPIRPDEHRAFGLDLETLAGSLRILVASGSEEKMVEVSEVLSRKMFGAKDAIEHSADGVSQGANSLIEFIDRLLRGAFSDEYVLEWIEKNYSVDVKVLQFKGESGKVKPTKRGQALCFAHGGQATEPSAFHQIAAAGLQETRAKLQKLKHGDLGTDEEKAQLAQLIVAVEGYFLFAIRVGWASFDNERLDELRVKLQTK